MMVAGTWELARQMWPEPLTGPYLNTGQRARLAEDLLLATDASLHPDDHGTQARQIREVAARIRDNRTPADRRLAQELGTPLASTLQLPDDAASAAQRAWQRLRDVPVSSNQRMTRDQRAARIARQAWYRAYGEAYRTAYATAAAQIVAAATDAAVAQPATWPALHPLIAAAAAAIGEQKPEQLPQPDDATIHAARDAAARPMLEPWRPVAQTAWRAGRIAGTEAGTHAATYDIATGWQTRVDEPSAAHHTANGTSVQEWSINMLANIGRQARNATATVAHGGGGPVDRPVTASVPARPRSAPQDQVPSRLASVGPRPAGYADAVPVLRPFARGLPVTADQFSR